MRVREGFGLTRPNLGGVSSWPRKIYLLFWLTLICGTGLGAFLIPRILDGSQEQGYREIDGQGRPPMAEVLSGDVSTRFPVRPFVESVPSENPGREAFPGMRSTPSAERTPGLPQRDVMSGVPAATPGRDPVTSRVRVVQNASVYESPRTTARVLGTVAPGTQVRWSRTVEPGWEEILLNDGRSVYMQSATLSIGGAAEPVPVENPPAGDSSEFVAQLPTTVESFLGTLRDGELLRAGTYLAAEAPPLDQPDLGVWAALVGPQADAHVLRMESVTGRGSDWRSVTVLDQANGVQILTTWKWEAGQERWLLAGWE